MPSHNSGTAIVVLPGGAHEEIVWTSEGINVARALNRMGISVFVVKYRLAGEPGSTYSVERDETADVRRAMQWVRAHAGEYNIDPHRIGLMGFSAGGELVGMLADYGMTGAPAGGDPLDRVSSRPDFQVLVFPGPAAVRGPVPKDAPPAFPGRREQGRMLRPANSRALRVVAEGRRARRSCTCTPTLGMRLISTSSNRISILHWPDRLYDWLADSGFLDGRQPAR